MSLKAIVFAGQGAQAVGMGKDLADAYPECKALFNKADEALGYSLSKICFEGPVEELTKTTHCQPAIFAASDEMAVGAMQVCLENGVSVPGDMSVIGFDDNPLALNYSPVHLTTIRQPLHKMAMVATQTLNQIIQKKIRANKRIVLSTELVERSSCRVLG